MGKNWKEFSNWTYMENLKEMVNGLMLNNNNNSNTLLLTYTKPQKPCKRLYNTIFYSLSIIKCTFQSYWLDTALFESIEQSRSAWSCPPKFALVVRRTKTDFQNIDSGMQSIGLYIERQ